MSARAVGRVDTAGLGVPLGAEAQHTQVFRGHLWNHWSVKVCAVRGVGTPVAKEVSVHGQCGNRKYPCIPFPLSFTPNMGELRRWHGGVRMRRLTQSGTAREGNAVLRSSPQMGTCCDAYKSASDPQAWTCPVSTIPSDPGGRWWMGHSLPLKGGALSVLDRTPHTAKEPPP